MEAERPARLVDVEPVGIQVVRDVQVGPPVLVHIDEGRSETVVDVLRLDPRLQGHLLEAWMTVRVDPLVEVEEIAERLVVEREAAR